SIHTHSPLSPLSPYTTLFRSPHAELHVWDHATSGDGRWGHDGTVQRGDGGGARRGDLPLPLRMLHQRIVGRAERVRARGGDRGRSEEHTSELQSHLKLVCRLL